MEDYEKKYNDLIERLREAYNDEDINDERFCCVIADIVPELRESEDEKVVKMLTELVQATTHITVYDNKDKVLAWLKKQGENSFSVDCILDCLGIAPAYKDGDAWCILLGDNIQEGICGFGDTKEDAFIEFLKELLEKQAENKEHDVCDTCKLW